MPNDPTHAYSSDASSTGKAADEARNLKLDVVNKAGEMRDAAIDAAHSKADDAKSGVADEISSVGNALRRASDELRDGSPQERTFGQMAGTLADLSDTVRDKDMSEMVGDLSDFARRNPVAFLGGAALAGFAGVRMAKASQRNQDATSVTTRPADTALNHRAAPGRQTTGDVPAYPPSAKQEG